MPDRCRGQVEYRPSGGSEDVENAKKFAKMTNQGEISAVLLWYIITVPVQTAASKLETLTAFPF